MASYVVMEPPLGTADDRAAGARLVRDGFAFFAFVLPFFWFLFHRMWIEAGIALALIFVLGFLDEWIGLPGAATLLTLALSLFAGLEARNLRKAALARRGWREWGVVEARNGEEAELRYLAEAGLDEAQEPATKFTPAEAPARTSVPAMPARSAGGPALGMFDYPGRR